MKTIGRACIVLSLDGCIVEVSMHSEKNRLKLSGKVLRSEVCYSLQKENGLPTETDENPFANLYRRLQILVKKGFLEGPFCDPDSTTDSQFLYATVHVDVYWVLRELENLGINEIRILLITINDEKQVGNIETKRDEFMPKISSPITTVSPSKYQATPEEQRVVRQKDTLWVGNVIATGTIILLFIIGVVVWGVSKIHILAATTATLYIFWWIFRAIKSNTVVSLMRRVRK